MGMIQKLKLDDYFDHFDQFENRRTNFILVIMCLPKTDMTLLIHHLPSSLQPRDLVISWPCTPAALSKRAGPRRPVAQSLPATATAAATGVGTGGSRQHNERGTVA